jgi:hypothetical protein
VWQKSDPTVVSDADIPDPGGEHKSGKILIFVRAAGRLKD